MTMPRMAATVVLRHPDSDAPVALLAGSECPDWAVGRIDASLLVEESAKDDSDEKKRTPARRRTTKK